MFKIVKKQDMQPRQILVMRGCTVVAALVFAALVILLLGYNPITVYSKIIEGSLFTSFRIQETLHKAIPLIVLSLGVSIAFKMKFWNIGAEGQFYLGAFGASLVALNLPELPAYILLPLMFFAGFVFGGIWSLIPALIKAKLGASESLVTLMMNYIAIKFITYLQYGPWKDPDAHGFAKIAKFSENAVLPKVFGIQSGWIVALVLTALVFVMFKYTKLGYQITVIGENPQTARYAGMNVNKILIIAVVMSGGICGIAGMMQASAIERSLSDQLSCGMGFTAIITSWLARLEPATIIIVSILFSILLKGGAYIQTALQVPSSVAEVIQGIILFFVLASDFFVNYKIVFTPKSKQEA